MAFDMYRDYSNINEAFEGMVKGIVTGSIQTKIQKMNGNTVIRVPGPSIVTLSRCNEPVLFNTVRNINVFEYLDSSLKMLGRVDEVGKIIMPQVELLINTLYHLPENRNCSVQIRDWLTTEKIGKGKNVSDVISLAFEVNQNKAKHALNMTVITCSANMINDTLGYDAFRFSMLHRYIAASIGLSVGKYFQFTSNMYVDGDWLAEEYTKEVKTMHSPDYKFIDEKNLVPLIKNTSRFNEDLKKFTENKTNYEEPFFQNVVHPMSQSYESYTEGDIKKAKKHVLDVKSYDFMEAGKAWINRNSQGSN